MLSLIAASALFTAQPAGPPLPLVVELCNATPARVAYSVVYQGERIAHRRRGWLTVEPNDCLSGAIGTTVGGDAYVHSMSGEYRWPAERSDITSCIPPNAHDSMAQPPACQSGNQELGFERVALASLGGRYELTHRVSCGDLSASDAQTCRSGRRSRDGFAEPVRTLEVCNFSDGPVEAAIVADALGSAGRQITGWITVAGEAQCTQVWRGLTIEPVVYLHVRGNQPSTSGPAPARYCVPSNGDFDRISGVLDEAQCDDDEDLVAFRAVRFGSNVSHVSFDIGS